MKSVGSYNFNSLLNVAYLTTKMADSCVPPVGHLATLGKGKFKRQVVVTEMLDDETIEWKKRKYRVTDISTGKQWTSMGQYLKTEPPFWQVVPVDNVYEDGTVIPECCPETLISEFDEPMEEEKFLLQPEVTTPTRIDETEVYQPNRQGFGSIGE